MAGPSTAWWERTGADWTTGPGLKAVQLLATAYQDPVTIERIARAAGVTWEDAPFAGPAGERWRWVLDTAAREQRGLGVLAEALAGADSAFRRPLENLAGDRLDAAYAYAGIKYGHEAIPPERRQPALESVVVTAPSAGAPTTARLEAVASRTATLAESGAVIEAFATAKRRTAMLEQAGAPIGTGFLVGPDLLLTAAHVAGLGKPWPPEPRPPLVARFDYSPMPGRSQAETGDPVAVRDFLERSLPTEAEIQSSASDWEAPEDRLDFALLLLAEPAGTERGFYPITADGYDFAHSPPLFIPQHALGEFQSITFLEAGPKLNAAATRVEYAGITQPGSSGSPVINVRGHLTAMHHFAREGTNQGIPVARIFAALIAAGYRSDLAAQPAAGARPVGTIDPFMTREFLGHPFVDRRGLRDKMRSMAERPLDSPRTLVIRGPSGAGVSYSYRLAAHVAERAALCSTLRTAAPEGLAAVRLDFRRYASLPTDERLPRIAAALLSKLDVATAGDPLAQAPRDVVGIQDAVEGALRSSRRQRWIFFDNIDSAVAVRAGGVGELIHAIVELTEDEQNPLRVILAGQEADRLEVGGIRLLDDATGFARTEVEQWLVAQAREAGHAVPKERLDAALAEHFPAGGTALALPSALGPVLPAMLLELLDGGADGP